MTANAQLITRFYEAFARRDAEAMAACYADDIRFGDPVFTDLRGEQARDMWRMLTRRGKDLVVTFRDVQAYETTGSAHWDAEYTFSATGKKVLNRIDATFEFRGGKIVRHTDVFDLGAWCAQALGVPGRLFGRTRWLQNVVRKRAGGELAKFSAKRS